MNTEDNLRFRGFRSSITDIILKYDKVFICAHDNLDLDAISSSIGLYILCKKLKKECYIVIDEHFEEIEAGVRKVIDKERNKISFINIDKYLELASSNDLLIATDVNKSNRIILKDYLNKFGGILIIDHHEEDGYTIKTNDKFITIGVSSSSELVSKLLFDLKIGMSSDTATYLLAGIKLDTDNFRKNTDSDTLGICQRLMQKGASNEVIQSFFLRSYESDVKISELLKQIEFNSLQFAITCDASNIVYSREEIAKAADKAMKYGVDASFMIGYINEEKTLVAASARSNGKINVGKIMSELGGGGNPTSAATLTSELSIVELGNEIRLRLGSKYK